MAETPIYILFDNNILSRLAEEELRDRWRVMQSAISRQGLDFVISSVSILEQLAGVNDRCFEKVLQTISWTIQVCGSDCLLPEPLFHLCRNSTIGGKPIPLDNTIISLINGLIRASDFAEFEGKFHRELAYIRNSKLENESRLSAVYNKSSALLDTVPPEKVRLFFSDKGPEDFEEWFVPATVKNSFLSKVQHSCDRDILLRLFPGLRYYALYWQSVMREERKSNRVPRDSDNYDGLYLLYLDVVDYFVTADGFLRRIFDESDYPMMNGRVIGLSRLLELIESFQLIKHPLNNFDGTPVSPL